MRVVAPIFFVAFSAIVIAFSVKNLGNIEINPWPFAEPVQVPTYLVVFAAFIVGFFSGAVVAWVSGIQGRRRRKQRKAERDAQKAQPHPSAKVVPSVALSTQSGAPVAAGAERAIDMAPEKE